MGKLSPKPSRKTSFKTWKDLDEILQSNFGPFNAKSATISLDEYTMSKEEIIVQASKQGYKVTDSNDGYITFE